MGELMIFFMLIFATTGPSSCTWCVCKGGLSDSVLQKTLDYACGAGADCNPIRQTGACFQPNSVKGHCSYAVNSYYQRKGQSGATCDFSGTASITTSDPSSTGCAYPASFSSAVTTTTTPPSVTTPSTRTPTTASPYSTTPSNGVLGGNGTGLGTTGAGINTDVSDGGYVYQKTSFMRLFVTVVLSGSVILWG